MSLGTLLRAARQGHEMTQRELAEILGIDATYLSKLENDRARPSEELILRAASELQLDPTTLLLLAGMVPSGVRQALQQGPEAAIEALTASQRRTTSGDQLYDDIVAGLTQVSDGDLFEQCACSLLRASYATLASWPGGSDAGVDGVVVDESGRWILVVTTSARVARNLENSLRSYLKSGGEARVAILATSQSLSPGQRRKHDSIAKGLGFDLRTQHAREDFAELLYHEPRWLSRLLGLSGQPSALSVVPPSTRPLLGESLIGREEDLERLRDRKGDLVVAGQPGVGKTALMRKLALAGWGLFLADTSAANIANALRRERPRAVIVDDAPTQIEGLTTLLRLRSEYEALDFVIVATCWGGDEARILDLLSLASGSVYNIALLTQDEIVEVIASIGLLGPNGLVQHIVKQARGRPGLAAVLAHLALSREHRDLVSGDAVRRFLLANTRVQAQPSTLQVLAVLSLAGDQGMSCEAVAELLSISPPTVSATLMPLPVGGVIEEERRNGHIVVWPETLRYSLINEMFFGPIRILTQRLFDAVPDPHTLTRTLVRARLHGVPVPEDLLWRLVRDTGAAEDDYAAIGEEQTKRLLSLRPQAALRVAKEALEQAPEVVLPMLMTLGMGDARGIPQTPEHPLRKIDDWIDYAPRSRGEPIRRRRLLLDAIDSWIEAQRDVTVAGRALGIALSPRSKTSSVSPGSGMTVSYSDRYLEVDHIQELTALWAASERIIEALDRSGLHILVDVLHTYVHPMSIPGPTPSDISEAMDGVACGAMRLVMEMAATEPGVLYELRRLAGSAQCDLPIHLDADYEVVYPAKEPIEAHDWDDHRRRHIEALGNLADRLAALPAQMIVSRLREFQMCAPRNPPTFLYDSLAILAQEIAVRVSNPPEWIAALLEQSDVAWMAGSFLHRLSNERNSDTALWLRRALQESRSEWAAIGQILCNADLQRDLLDEVFPLLPGYAQSVHVMCLRGEVPIATVYRLLRHTDPVVAAGVATGIWHAHLKGEIPDELVEVWRIAMVRAPVGRTDVGIVFATDAVLARDWLMARILDRSITETIAVHDFAVTEACKALEMADRLEVIHALLDEFDEDEWRIVEEAAQLVIGDDLTTFQSILADGELRRCHLLGLTGMPDEGWAQKVIAALNAGYQVDDVVAAAYDTRLMSWTGDESTMWLEWKSAFSSILPSSFGADGTMPDTRLVEISQAGADFAQKQADRASVYERREAIYGRG